MTHEYSEQAVVEDNEREKHSAQSRDDQHGLQLSKTKIPWDAIGGVAAVVGVFVAIIALAVSLKPAPIEPEDDVSNLVANHSDILALKYVLENTRKETAEIGQSRAFPALAHVMNGFDNFDLSDLVLIGTTNHGTPILNSNLDRTKFLMSDLSNTIIDSTSMKDTAFVLTDLTNANLTILEGEQIQISGGTLDGATVRLEPHASLQLSGTSLVDADIILQPTSALNIDRSDLSKVIVSRETDAVNPVKADPKPSKDDPNQFLPLSTNLGAVVSEKDGVESRFHQTLMEDATYAITPTMESICESMVNEGCLVDFDFDLKPESYISRLGAARKYEASIGDSENASESVRWSRVNGSFEFVLTDGLKFNLPKILQDSSKSVFREHVLDAFQRSNALWRKHARLQDGHGSSLRKNASFNETEDQGKTVLDRYIAAAYSREKGSVKPAEIEDQTNSSQNRFADRFSTVLGASKLDESIEQFPQKNGQIYAAISICADSGVPSNIHLSSWNTVAEFSTDSAVNAWFNGLVASETSDRNVGTSCRLPTWHIERHGWTSLNPDIGLLRDVFENDGILKLTLRAPSGSTSSIRISDFARSYRSRPFGSKMRFARGYERILDGEALPASDPNAWLEYDLFEIGNMSSIYEATSLCVLMGGDDVECQVLAANSDERD
ncbi:MAG: hypothetical protein QNI84_05205 [Henriciella sp.]|nr:hypothetical protein [Henriciella sp.]